MMQRDTGETTAVDSDRTISVEPTVFAGGLVYGSLVALFFGGVMGVVLALPKAFEPPRDVVFYLLDGLVVGSICALPIGFILGGLIGAVNRRVRHPRPVGLATGGLVGLLIGIAVSFVLLWHRRNIDEYLGVVRAAGTYTTLALTLFPLVGSLNVLAGLALGWSVGFVIHLRADFRHRVVKGMMVGALVGCLTGLCVLGVILLILGPALKRYGAW